MFLMWLGEQITQRGIGNGISLIIFAGIVAEIPRALVTTFELGRTGAVSDFYDFSDIYFININSLIYSIYGKSFKKNINKLSKKTNGK